MRAATCLSLFLCASLAAASAAIDAFKRIDKVLEPRAAAQRKAPAHNHERLEKRASPYLNNVTQSECTADAALRPDAKLGTRIRRGRHQDPRRRCMLEKK